MKIGTTIIVALSAGSIGAVFAFTAPPTKTGFDADIAHNAQTLLNEGQKTFRFETFGSEAFWGDALQLHKAIAGEQNGGVGLISPKTALSVDLKVDADALPAALKKQLAAGKINLDDPATTIALLKLNVVVGVTLHKSRWQRQIDGDPMRVLPFDGRQLVRARNRQATRRLGQPRS